MVCTKCEAAHYSPGSPKMKNGVLENYYCSGCDKLANCRGQEINSTRNAYLLERIRSTNQFQLPGYEGKILSHISHLCREGYCKPNTTNECAEVKKSNLNHFSSSAYFHTKFLEF